MKDAKYYKEYREKKALKCASGEKSVHAKLDRILEILGEKKIVLPATLPKPVVRSEPIIPLSDAIGKTFEKHVPDLVGIVCKCGGPAFYEDAAGRYCATHATRDSNPI